METFCAQATRQLERITPPAQYRGSGARIRAASCYTEEQLRPRLEKLYHRGCVDHRSCFRRGAAVVAEAG